MGATEDFYFHYTALRSIRFCCDAVKCHFVVLRPCTRITLSVTAERLRTCR
jgi:hypothetical protein